MELCAGCGKEIGEQFAIVGVGEDLKFWHHPCYDKVHDRAGNYTGAWDDGTERVHSDREP